MSLRENLLLLMKSHKLTPHQLALKANIRTAALESILAGEKDGTSRERVAIAKTFNLEVDDLFVMATPEVDLQPDWLRTRELLRQWPPVARDRFLLGMYNAACQANHGLVSVAKDYQLRADRSGHTIDPGEALSIQQLTKKRGYR